MEIVLAMKLPARPSSYSSPEPALRSAVPEQDVLKVLLLPQKFALHTHFVLQQGLYSFPSFLRSCSTDICTN